jgi:hypothetical protein
VSSSFGETKVTGGVAEAVAVAVAVRVGME